MLIEDKILFMKTAPKAQGKADLPLDRQELNETRVRKKDVKKLVFTVAQAGCLVTQETGYSMKYRL